VLSSTSIHCWTAGATIFETLGDVGDASAGEYVDLRVRAQGDPESVSETDYVRLYLSARVLFRRFENDFFQYQSGTFDPGGWEGYRNSLVADVLGSPTLRAFWHQQRPLFAPDFVAYVEKQLPLVSQGEAYDLNRALQEWRELVARESAV
jgi:hypothetical protein